MSAHHQEGEHIGSPLQADGKRKKMVTLTDGAVAKVKGLMKDSNLGGPNPGLRLFVPQGGCSDTGTSYPYEMSLEEEPKVGDEILELEGLKVFVEKDSISYLKGMEIDYGETHLGKGFVMRNPNAVHTCGCGHTSTPKNQ